MDDAPRNSYASIGANAFGPPIPDCNYVSYQFDPLGGRAIPTTRDLEDYARLWICGISSNLLAALPTGSTVSLSWGDLGNPNVSNPTIDLFASVESNGGTGYLTNSELASIQVQQSQSQNGSAYIGRLGPGQSLQLNAKQFGGWAGNHYIWCGASNGTGGLVLTVSDANSNVLAQATTYIQIVDIKQMYERWTVGDQLKNAPNTNAIPATEDLPLGTPAFQYPHPQDTNTPYILFVHGWNMTTEDKERFAETAFKRLYWQGYHGRFGLFRWPTGNNFKGIISLATNPNEADNYDLSEYNAWLSGVGLLNKLNDLNRTYPGHVYLLAHSMGNVVAGEALRLAGNNQVVNTYVASQAAVPAHTYDPTVANYSFSYSPWSSSAKTPNIYGNWFSGNNGGGAGQVISFFNINDFALQRSVWQLNQLFKPDDSVNLGGDGHLTYNWSYIYGGSANDPAPWNHFSKNNNTLFYRENYSAPGKLDRWFRW
jgi:pimeloyl-ACP methyl ester carboxylesterase